MSNQKIVTEAALSALASDIKNALSGKANSDDVYTKTEVDNALGLKADKSEIYNVYPTDQESGAIAHITDGADNIPVKSLVSQIIATGGGGTPDAPIAINGFDSGIITRCGKNLITLNSFDFTLSSVRFYTSGGDLYLNGTSTSEISSRNTAFKNLNFILKAGTYYFSRGNANTATYLYDYYDGANPPIITNNGSFTLTKDTRVYIGFYVNNNKTFDNLKIEFMISEGSSATTFEPYNANKTYTFTFGQTVYGGHFDNKGNLVVTHKKELLSSLSFNVVNQHYFYADISDLLVNSSDMLCEIYKTMSPYIGYNESNFDNESISISQLSKRIAIRDDNYSDVVSFTNSLNGYYVNYPLENPIILSITSQDIPTLLGENNIFSNTGDVEVDYHADIGLYIDKKISSLAQG